MTLLIALSWHFLLILVPERAWVRQLEGVIQTPAGGPLHDEMLSRGEKILTKLEGKVAVITGGSSGIGLATARRFISEGAYVYITGRRQRELDAAERQIGKNVTAVQGDVSNLADLDRLYATVQQQHGRIDIVFANAGVVEVASLGEISEAHFDKTFNINVKGLLFTVQKALPLLQDGGSIILNAGAGSIKGAPAFSVSCAQAAAIRSFARSWTLDLQARQIRVNAVSPGPINTPGLRGLGQTEEQGKQIVTSLVTTNPLGRMGDPDEIAKAVVFLASNDSSFITGIELFVDGGEAQV
jgi:NAD(P)-dependent dehydrogenase (short-subunit alcohol dehydrogenase family)